MKHILKISLFCFLMSALFCEKAYAYIDPGTGSMLLQIILAALIAFGAFFKTFFNKIKLLFIKADKNDPEK